MEYFINSGVNKFISNIFHIHKSFFYTRYQWVWGSIEPVCIPLCQYTGLIQMYLSNGIPGCSRWNTLWRYICNTFVPSFCDFFFKRSTFVGSSSSFAFSSLPQLPITSDLGKYIYPRFYPLHFLPILILATLILNFINITRIMKIGYNNLYNPFSWAPMFVLVWSSSGRKLTCLT